MMKSINPRAVDIEYGTVNAYRCIAGPPLLYSYDYQFRNEVSGMRKTINIAALLFFIWLLLSNFDVPSILLNFLLVGELPGASTSLSPSLMLAIMTMLSGIIIFELLARKMNVVRQTRKQLVALMDRRTRLPKRRYSRI